MLRRAGLPAVNPRRRAVEFLAQIDGSLVQSLLGYGRVQIQLVASRTAFEAATMPGEKRTTRPSGGRSWKRFVNLQTSANPSNDNHRKLATRRHGRGNSNYVLVNASGASPAQRVRRSACVPRP